MPVRTAFTTFVAVLLLIGGTTHDAHAQSATTFTYQGYLEDGGAPATGSFDFQFELYDSASSGTQVGATVEVTDVTVTDGVFAVDLDFGAVFGAELRYLEVAAKPSGSGSYTTLSPREALRPAPLATALPYLRVERATDGNGDTAINVIGGDPSNTVASDVTGATISGGGYDPPGGTSNPNQVEASFATIGGGLGNFASGEFSTVGGGFNNAATDIDATVGGGFGNSASDLYATISGGRSNTASGNTATVPGGRSNEAGGLYSFAAGFRAKAQNTGAFVWADSEDADFTSTATDQFLISARGGVGIGTNSPSSPLTVNGAIESTSGGIVFPDGTTQTTAGVSSGNAWSLGGNSGTDPTAGDFLGTTDDVPLELRVNDTRALRLERVTNSLGETATNVIGGDPSNTVANGVTGATIAGGGIDDGTSSFPNEITARFGTIGGGLDNTASGSYATVGGGGDNTASELYATVGGGFNNTASGFDATVGGGRGNTASGNRATVGGGESNTASGFVATVPGGRFNEASGNYSFAAGRRAKAQNNGTFVWADSEDADFASTADDQFLVRSDFVGINRATTIGLGEVFGIRANTSGSSFGGMYIEATSSSGLPYYGYAVDGDNPAYHYYDPSSDEWVLFVSAGGGGENFTFNSDGDLDVPGRLTKGSGSFMIDHPQAPTEKTLSHSFVESPDMMNVYNGTVTLGADGTATVELPGYFEALNKDFRYQLTPIGAPGPNLHVATEIEDNRFRIAGGAAGMRVSWQVTGIRNDPYARKNRIRVEEEKAPEDRGTYLHPEAYRRDR